MKNLILAGHITYQRLRQDMIGRQAMGANDQVFIHDIPVQPSNLIPSEEIWFVNDSKSINCHTASPSLADIVAMIVNIGLPK